MEHPVLTVTLEVNSGRNYRHLILPDSPKAFGGMTTAQQL